MTPEAALVRADSQKEAEAFFDEFDVVPYPGNGPIAGFFRRGDGGLTRLNSEIVISDSTAILELPQLFLRQPSLLVLRGQRIVGLVHFSDLNNPIVKLPLYVMFEAVESELIPALNRRASEADLKAVLGSQRLRKIRKSLLVLRSHRAEYGLAQGLYFSELLALAAQVGVVVMTKEELSLLTDVRNRIAHADTPLVRDLEDARSLLKAKEAFGDLERLLAVLPSAAG
jgi:hypothetical protein